MTDSPETVEPEPERLDPESDDSLWSISSTGQTVNNIFAGAQFGSATLGFGDAARSRATGKLPKADRDELGGAFVEPPGFPDVARRLGTERMVVLPGPVGRGKRTSALRLLRRTVEGEIFLLSPRMRWTELTERVYERGCGYALIDHAAETELDSFGRQLLRDRLSEAGAHLVVTTTDATGLRTAEWRLPDLMTVLRERVSVEIPDEYSALLTESLGGVVRVGDVAELARRLDNGESAVEAVRHLDTKAEEAVRQWFDAAPSRRRVAEVTVLAFAVRMPVRVFDRMLGALLREMAPPSTGEESAGDERDTAMPRIREGITGPGSLIVRKKAPVDTGTTRIELDFEVSAYHRHVVRALWERYSDEDLWDPVRRWLNGAVENGDWSVVLGLAALSEIDLGEVLDIIDPWACRERGMNGQYAAHWVLTAMAYQDVLAPIALRIATRWITGDDIARRVTAAAAFGEQLGVRFPHDAVRRLWVLVLQPSTPPGVVAHALPELFTNLTRAESTPAIVLNRLEARLTDPAPTRSKTIPVQHIRQIALRVLAARDRSGGRSTLARYLTQHRNNLRSVGTIWIELLRNRPTRQHAFRLFGEVVRDLAEHEEQPESTLDELARAIGERLPAGEPDTFEQNVHRACHALTRNPGSREVLLLRDFVGNVLEFAPLERSLR